MENDNEELFETMDEDICDECEGSGMSPDEPGLDCRTCGGTGYYGT